MTKDTSAKRITWPKSFWPDQFDLLEQSDYFDGNLSKEEMVSLIDELLSMDLSPDEVAYFIRTSHKPDPYLLASIDAQRLGLTVWVSSEDIIEAVKGKDRLHYRLMSDEERSVQRQIVFMLDEHNTLRYNTLRMTNLEKGSRDVDAIIAEFSDMVIPLPEKGLSIVWICAPDSAGGVNLFPRIKKEDDAETIHDFKRELDVMDVTRSLLLALVILPRHCPDGIDGFLSI